MFEFVFNLCEETNSRTDEGQPRPKYIFNKCGTNIYFFFTIQRFGPSPSPNFKCLLVFVQDALKCFEEALERANLESEEDERYYKLIAITIRLGFILSPK